jgi:hypothetical protein
MVMVVMVMTFEGVSSVFWIWVARMGLGERRVTADATLAGLGWEKWTGCGES